MKFILSLFFTITTVLSACDTSKTDSDTETDAISSNDDMASIVSVTSSGEENNYTFSVGISSPDKGCSQYADWWEVVTEDGSLIYRRVLGHSHINEQPFVRSGGVVAINANQIVIIRAHMNTSGYGINAYKGSVESGFALVTLDDDFAQNLATVAPLPESCAF